ncbi:DUF2273 domain-containing protein [Dietzia timorensis]|uniref:DUF2273 domain-containing protein n=1 Tax=Dietzia timorensis TaxID=499555 RepID=A0A173LLL6_9ACTN|nr:DUF2273 domain-containing protein [Dietzia timorensis]ANI93176.1 Hypothetical protein BJL86_2412 [Dietzia timorensis]
MKYTAICAVIGLLLAIAGIIGGVGAFVFALLLAVIGGVAGAHLDGLIDLSAVVRGRGRG